MAKVPRAGCHLTARRFTQGPNKSLAGLTPLGDFSSKKLGPWSYAFLFGFLAYLRVVSSNLFLQPLYPMNWSLQLEI